MFAIHAAVRKHCDLRPRSRREFLRTGHLGGLLAALRLELRRRRSRIDSTPDAVAVIKSTESDSAAAEGGDGSDSESGQSESEDGGESDGEPPISTILANGPEWWQTSLLVAAIVTVAVFLVLLVIWKPNRFYLPTLLATFFLSFAVTNYFDPRLWHRRMAEACLSMLGASTCLGGLQLKIPVPWASTPILVQLPETHWSIALALATLTAVFAGLHFMSGKTDAQNGLFNRLPHRKKREL